MGLFWRNKKKKLLPPKFPDIPSDIPKYEGISPEHKEIKEAITPPLDIPQRVAPKIQPKPIGIDKSMPSFSPPQFEETRETFEPVKKEKTLYVKIDRYKKAMETLDHIKSKIEESQKILDKLKEIKDEEDMELGSWQNNLDDLKEKLLEIDQKLFEE